MRSSRFYPLPLRNLYKLAISLTSNLSPEYIEEKFNIKSSKTIKQYEKTLKWITKNVKNFTSLDSFSSDLVIYLTKEFRLKEAINLLNEELIPITSSSLSKVLNNLGIEVSSTEARAMIYWLKQAGVLQERRIPVLTLSLEERVLEEMRSKGSVTYASLRRTFGDEVRDIIVSLWKKGLVSVPALDNHRDVITGAKNLDRIPGIPKGKIFATWQDRITGEAFSELVLPPRTRILARWSL